CRPCRPGCATCEDDTPCLIQEDGALRAAVLACQACCMLAIFLSMLVSYHFRRSKARIRTSGIVLLETILFGSLLLYFPVSIRLSPGLGSSGMGWFLAGGIQVAPEVWRVGSRWFPSSGGIQAVPGRWDPGGSRAPAGGIQVVPELQRVGSRWFLAVGRAEGSGPPHWDGLGSHCRVPAVGAQGPSLLCPAAEMLFLLWGSFLCYATRAVPSAFHEPRYMGIALHNELMVSAAFHVVRVWVPGEGRRLWGLEVGRGPWWDLALPSWSLPVTPASLPAQFLHTGSPLREEITAEVYEDELDMRRSGSCMNSSIASAWSEHSLDPDDIRVHKTWRMAANNPHLPKKRSSRRSVARSILRR
ncbi:GP158 protein, partial [Oriolus oriolus]|nr:GP158 protein [Oriolus oriolus]